MPALPGHRSSTHAVLKSAVESKPALTSPDEVDLPSLLSAAQSGDADAFGELCRAHETRLFRQALALCGNHSAAEELAQDTLIAAWKSIRRYHGRCQLFTWLCAILIHLHRNRIRAKGTWARLFATITGDNDESNNVPDDTACPATTIESSENAAVLQRCLDALPQKQREVIFLRFYVDESLEGVAAALDCSVGTVKSRLFNGLEKLRKMRNLTTHFRESDHKP